MNGYSIRYSVDIENANGYYDGEIFDNEENAKEYVSDCIENGEAENNPIVYYKITKTETSGGMIVTEEIITEVNCV